MRRKGKLNLEITLLFLGIFLGAHNLLANNLSVYENYVFSFGLGNSWVLLVQIVFILFVLGFYLREKSLSLSLLLVGGLINLIDRLSFTYVRDYWSLGFLVNNIADWIIGIGVLLFLIESLWKRKLK